MEKFLEKLTEAEKIIKTTDHMVYTSFPMVKDKRLLLRVLSEIKSAITICITSILQYEYLYKRISLYKEPRTNFRIFKEKCAQKYGITKEEIKLILELFELAEKHERSPMEFSRKGKIIILSENSDPKIFSLDKSKEFLILAKSILKKTKEIITENVKNFKR